MEALIKRKPFALANWKMAMTVPESLSFVHEFMNATENLVHLVETVLCPPYTAIHALSHVLADTPVELGAQNLCALPGKSHTGEISAPLLYDVGCRWVMLGHWEVRRQKGESDVDINKKILAGFQAGLRPILLVGEKAAERGRAEKALSKRLSGLFEGCNPDKAIRMVVVYEPEWAIGAAEPASSNEIEIGCAFVRNWIGRKYGAAASKLLRIVYGGSVTPERAEKLLSSPNVDGLGAGRMGRDPLAFARIVRTIASAKGLV